MLGNINYPVRVSLAIELKNGNKHRFTCALPESEKQLIERLYTLSTRTEPKEDPRQLNLHTQLRGPTRITTVSGRVIETKDGVVWEEVHGVPSPLRSEPKQSIKSKADCDHFGFYCDTEKCPYLFYSCSDRADGSRIRTERLQAAKMASETVKDKRGRKRKTPESAAEAARLAAKKQADDSREIEACTHYPHHCGSPTLCPRSETDCYRRKDGRAVYKKKLEKEQSEKQPKHSGEICKGKVAECESFCTARNCVHWGKPLTHWAICKGEGFPFRCAECKSRHCYLLEPPKDRICQIENSMCNNCGNPYCAYSLYEPVLSENETIVPVETVMGACRTGVSMACLGCQDTGCKYCRAEPLCKTGFPEICNTTCENEKCVFYKWGK